MQKHQHRHYVAGFIIPYKCPAVKHQEKLDKNRMRVKKGRIRLSPNEEAAIIKEETEKRRKLRLQQVREQSKENAAKIRHAVKQEKHKQLMKLATEIKSQLEDEKAERVRHLEQQYDNSLRNIGLGHKTAGEQPDWSEERELVQRAENLRAEARGRSATEKLKQQTARKNHEMQKHIIARKSALEQERLRAAEMAAMPPPPPDPLKELNVKPSRPVKVTDMNTFSNSHYHMQNEHAVDRADPLEQENARDLADVEHERIQERALELKRLRTDQLERARQRHNIALEKELLKHDYNHILHDLSDLQRADRDRRTKIVHTIPKQVFQPPNFRMEDREDKQRQLEQEFEDMYMARTDYMGNISLALDPQPPPLTPNGETSLDVTGGDIDSPLQEPTLPHAPPVLRDMTNMPRPTAKKPEKVLRSLMDRIKSQREEWMTSQSQIEVGEGPQLSQRTHTQQQQHMTNGDAYTTVNGGDFQPLIPDNSPLTQQGYQEFSPPEKLPRVQSPVPPPRMQQQTVPPGQQNGHPVMPSAFTAEGGRQQQTNVQIQGVPSDIQQVELAEILKQQELIAEQKRQLELKLQQLTYEQHRVQMTNRQPQQLTQPQATAPSHLAQQPNIQQQPLPAQAQTHISAQPPAPSKHHPLQPQLLSSMSSSGMSQHPMNSIPPTHTTNSVSVATTQGQGHQKGQQQGYPQGYQMRSAYQPPSAALTTDQLVMPASMQTQYQSQHTYQVQGQNVQQGQNVLQSRSTQPGPVSMPTNLPPTVSMGTYSQGQSVPYPDHIPPATLTSEGHTDQMRKVKEYQEHLLAKHEQSKKVLEETKNEIKRRRENLLERYPKLDLSRLEDLGAKYLQNPPSGTVPQQGQIPTTTVPQSEGQGPLEQSLRSQQSQSVPISTLLASLASHPYYAATLSQPGAPQSDRTTLPTSQQTANITVGNVHQTNGYPHPDQNLDTNMRQNKQYDNLRKSLPFDADDTLPTPVRVYEAYAQYNLDTTSGTDVTDADTSSMTEKGSPALKPAQYRPGSQFRTMHDDRDISTTEESEMDTTASGSFLSEKDDMSKVRQNELYKQLADIQRQKEEIIRIHQAGQTKLQSKEVDLKVKLATLAPEDIGQRLRESLGQIKEQQAQASLSTPVVQKEAPTQNGRHPSNLSTIIEVETPTPVSTARLSDSSGEGGSLVHTSKRSLDFAPQTHTDFGPIAEDSTMEEEEFVKQNEAKVKYMTEPVANYSGSNIDNVLERAKRFETEVLEKLRKQTNAVLFDNEFDNSLEFDVSRRQVSAEPLSSGSITPESFSTGPLDESSINKSHDLRSANGSFKNSSKSWADELSQFKIPASDQSSLSFKLMKPDSNRSSIETQKQQKIREDSVFTGDVNRFKVYSSINNDSNSTDSEKSEMSSASSTEMAGKPLSTSGIESVTVNAVDMLEHLRNLQRELHNGEDARKILAKKLAEQQNDTSETPQELSQYSINSREEVSRPFMDSNNKSDLSQYSLTDTSTDQSQSPVAHTNQPQKSKMSHDYLIQSGTSSLARELPVRRSPIGDNLRAESPILSANQSEKPQELTTTEYSFSMSDGKQQRSTSTPGEDRRKSALDGQTSIRSELPSAITVGDKSVSDKSAGVRFSGIPDSKHYHDFNSPNLAGFSRKSTDDRTDLSSYSISTGGNESSENRGEFRTLYPDRHMDSSSGQDLTSYSITSAEESLENIKKEFKKIEAAQAELGPSKVKTFAVSRDGDLISEHSDSDKSHGYTRSTDPFSEDLTTYTLSTNNGTSYSNTQDGQLSLGDSRQDRVTGLTPLSTYSIDQFGQKDSTQSGLSDYTIKSSCRSDSGESNPKSSSFTNVTSDPSLNATGVSNLSQYTFNETSETPNSANNENANNLVQKRFAGLDNLISESKHLIARHKVIIDKNKQLEEVPTTKVSSNVKSIQREEVPTRNVPSELKSSEVEVAPPVPLSTYPSALSFKPSFNVTNISEGSSVLGTSQSRLSSNDTSNQSGPGSLPNYDADASRSFNKTGDQTDINSLEYLIEHSSGITDEPLPDLSSMTLGSEISISEAFNRTEDFSKTGGNKSDSEDSLMSFEKHEVSESEDISQDLSKSEVSRADSLEAIVEARKYNFMVNSERRAAALKEHILAQSSSRSGGAHDITPARDSGHQVFRAMPVNVVAEPTLSMSVNVSGAERGRSPKPVEIKRTKSVSDSKKSFEAKESEIKASMSPRAPLNRALLPRGWESESKTVSDKDSGSKPTDSMLGSLRTKEAPKPASRFSRSLSASPARTEEKPDLGKLAGEIRQFGGSTGLSPKFGSPSTPKKTPPKVLPKPVRSKPAESQPSQNPSGLSKTLSSWKKSRTVTVPSKPAQPAQPRGEAPKNSIKVLPEEAPMPLTEEERIQKLEDEQYEKHIRLQHRLDSGADDAGGQTGRAAERPKEAKKDSMATQRYLLR